MTGIPLISNNTKESNDDEWEDCLVPGRRQPSTIPSTSTALNATSTRKNTRLPDTLNATSHTHGDFSAPGLTEHKLTDIVEPLLIPSWEEAKSPGPGPFGTLVSRAEALLSTIVPKIKSCISCTVVRMTKSPVPSSLIVLACALVIVFILKAISTSSSAPAPLIVDFPRLLNLESGTFEALLDESVKGPVLALQMKDVGIATSDLATLVRISGLNSREVLAESLNGFAKDARKVSRGLTRFDSKVRGTVDDLITVNGHALHAIESADSKSRALLPSSLWPFSPSEATPKQVIARTFTVAMNTLSINLERLILEAEVSMAHIDKLEQKLESIHELISLEDASITKERADLLAQLWTIFGGNRDEVHGMDNHLALLKDVGRYREGALAVIVPVLQMMDTMAADLEELRQRAVAPQLVGDVVPMEVHIKTLRSGVERLKGIRKGEKIADV